MSKMLHYGMNSKPLLPVLVGPTAVGKSALAIRLARKLRAEIVSADSRQVYRYMDIGTAKPSKEELGEIPHHFVSIVDPDQTYSAGRFGEEACGTIAAIQQQNRRVLVVGGSGLYVRALTDGLFEGVVKDEEIRKRIRRRFENEGCHAVHLELAKLDPEAAARIHPHDARRIERAMEVFLVTGRTLSDFQRSNVASRDFRPVFIGLDCDRQTLYRRIEDRVDRMLEEGVVEETEELLRRGYSETLVSMESLGYREIVSFLKGRTTRDRMIELFKQGSRQYAKRQWTWFRKDPRIRWFANDSSVAEEYTMGLFAE